MTIALFVIVLALGVFLHTYNPREPSELRIARFAALLLFLIACGTLLLRADPVPIAWSGGTEFTVANAPPGYESLHFGASFSFTQAVADGQYVVTFSFIEPTVQAVGQRVFDVSINDQPVVKQLDVFARAGFMVPLTRSVIVDVKGGRMVFSFVATVRSAVVSGIVIEPLTNVVLTTN